MMNQAVELDFFDEWVIEEMELRDAEPTPRVEIPRLPFAMPKWTPKAPTAVSSEVKAKVVSIADYLEKPKASHVLDGKTDQDEIKARKYEYSNLAMEMEAKAKGKGSYNSVFPNQQATIMQYVLVKMKEDGLITNGDVDKAVRFHEVVRTHMDRRNHKIGTCEYLASYVTDESFHKLGFNDKSIKKCISILTQIGYIKVVTVKGVQRYIYPMLYRLESSDYMPNVTFDEANNYLYPKKND